MVRRTDRIVLPASVLLLDIPGDRVLRRLRRLRILVTRLMARGTQRLNCSMHGSMENHMNIGHAFRKGHRPFQMGEIQPILFM